MTGDKTDLIPRKCSTNLPTRCRTTIGLPTGFSQPPGLLPRSSTTSRSFVWVVLLSLNFHPKDVSKQHFVSRPSPLQPRRLPRSLWFPKGRKGGKSRTAGVENGNSYVVRERGGRRREGAREEGGAGLRPRPPPGAAPERVSVQLLWVSAARLGSPGLGSPEDASAWSSLREPSCLQPLPVQPRLWQRRLRCVRFLQQLPRAGRTWRRESEEAG